MRAGSDIDFRLSGAHPRYAREIEAEFLSLSEQYPMARLRSVSLYEPRGHDTSMGATLEGCRIVLNAYWFAGDPDRLDDAAKRDVVVEAAGTEIGWHGPMIREPRQVLHHEFGHCVNQVAPKLIDPWARERWLAATREPITAPSGYALGSAPEWFAEMFALCSLGLATQEEHAEMSDLLRKI